jgi:hypothetical protein
MSEERDPRATANPTDSIAAFWSRCFDQSDHEARALLELMQTAGDPQQMQQRWLGALAQSVDSFMRSPAFLQAMQQNIKAMTDLKGLQGQVTKSAARQVGAATADDITGLFERASSVERAILHRLEQIDSRLDAIETMLRDAPGRHS